ncbi:MAG: alpha/beta hydrolase [Nocardioidaceae bacterium]|jgi:proline iminopeptidase|nr:alpha/beta hydrolase [Nocardioidaceae bacterium]
MRVSIGAVRLFVEVFGQHLALDGRSVAHHPTLVGLHGGPGVDGTALRYWLAPLADTAQVVVPDLRGHGRSDRGDPADWNLATWASDIHELCGVLGIEQPVLLGMSFGGFLAQHYAATYPDDIAGLILISTAPRYPGPEAVLSRAQDLGGAEAAAALRRLIDAPGTNISAEDRRRLQCLYQRRQDPGAEALEGQIIRTPEVAQAWVPHARQTMDLRPALQAVRCPTLVLAGELDPFNPPELAAEIVHAITDGQSNLAVVPGAAHRVLADNPEFAYNRIREVLSVSG